MNYLYPGQAARIWVDELGRYVDAFDTLEEVPDSYAGDKVGVPKDNIPNADGYAIGDQVYARPAQTAGAYPGIELVTAVVLALLLIVLIAIVAYFILNMFFSHSTSSVPDSSPTHCTDGSYCTSSKERLGDCFYRYDCCTGTLTKLNCATQDPFGDVIKYVIIGTVILGGGYIGIKYVLPALKKGGEKK